MSNFTRSILYSTSVLVAGLVAIFAIYSNIATTPNGSNVAQISPAAGGSDLGISINTPMDNMSSDAQSLIGPASYDADDAMQKAVDQIDSTINEFEAIKSSADGDKGSYYDAGQSFKLAASLGQTESQIQQELDDRLDTAVSTQQMGDMINSSTAAGITAATGHTSGYVGERVIAYSCRIGRNNDYDICTTTSSGRDGIDVETCTTYAGADAYTTNRDIYDGNVYSGSRGYSGYDNYYWGTCYRRSTFNEDMAYRNAEAQSGNASNINSAINSANSAINSAVSDALGSLGSFGSGGMFDPSDVTSAIDSARDNVLIEKVPSSVSGEIERLIAEERSRRGY